MTHEEAMKLALEALKKVMHVYQGINMPCVIEGVIALESALAKQSAERVEQGKPVAIVYASKAERDLYEQEDEDDTTPYVPKGRQQRPSRSDIKPLTEDEILKLRDQAAKAWQEAQYTPPLYVFDARAIEAAHGIKE